MAQNNPVSGTIWVNNGIINKRVSKENIPQGFTKGRHSENTK